MNSKQAVRTAALAACVSVFGVVTSAQAGKGSVIILDPYALTTVVATPSVTVASSVVYVPVAAPAASGSGTGKGPVVSAPPGNVPPPAQVIGGGSPPAPPAPRY